MKQIGKKLEQKLNVLANDLETALAIKAEADLYIETIKKQIRDIVSKYSLPEQTEKSQAYKAPNGIIRVTQPEASFDVDPVKLLHYLDTESFHKVCKVLKVEFDVAEWNKLKEKEWVTDEMLMNCIIEKGTPKARVSLEKRKNGDSKTKDSGII